MNEKLSQLVANLFARVKKGEEVSSDINRLRAELKNVVENEGTTVGKIRGLEESFRGIIPDEKQRYNGAIKALSAMLKMNREEIVKAVHNQIEEIKILEKALMPDNPGWRDEVAALTAKLRETRTEIANLRGKIAQLESQEREIVNGMASREKELEAAEKALRAVFADIGVEITAVKIKIEECAADADTAPGMPQQAVPELPIRQQPAVQQPSTQEAAAPAEKKEGGEQKNEQAAPPEPPDTEWQKKCPMCGGRMNLHTNEGIWLCYSCAHEEKTGEGQVRSEEKPHAGKPAEPAPQPEQVLPDTTEHQASKRESSAPTARKACPVCREIMLWYETDKAWRCPFCQYERRI